MPIDDSLTFMQQEEPIIESTQEEKFQQMSEDLEGALDAEVDYDESGIEPFMIHEVDEHLQVVEVQEVDTMIQDKIVPVQHIDFVFLEEFYGVMELKVIQLSVLWCSVCSLLVRLSMSPMTLILILRTLLEFLQG